MTVTTTGLFQAVLDNILGANIRQRVDEITFKVNNNLRPLVKLWILIEYDDLRLFLILKDDRKQPIPRGILVMVTDFRSALRKHGGPTARQAGSGGSLLLSDKCRDAKCGKALNDNFSIPIVSC